MGRREDFLFFFFFRTFILFSTSIVHTNTMCLEFFLRLLLLWGEIEIRELSKIFFLFLWNEGRGKEISQRRGLNGNVYQSWHLRVLNSKEGLLFVCMIWWSKIVVLFSLQCMRYLGFREQTIKVCTISQLEAQSLINEWWAYLHIQGLRLMHSISCS